MLTLYQFGNSVCSQKVRLTLHLKALEYDIQNVDLFKNEQYSPAYLKINPAALVPSLVDGTVIINESTLICEYLEAAYPSAPLLPPDPALQAKARLWSKMVDEGLHEGVTELSFSAMFRDRLKAMSPQERAVRFENVGNPKRTDRFKSTFEHGVGSPFVRYAVYNFERAFDQLEQSLSHGAHWILGGDVSLADLNLIPYAARLHYLGILPLWLADRPRARGWWESVLAWQPFKAVIDNELSKGERDTMLTAGTAILPALEAIYADVVATYTRTQTKLRRGF